MAKRRSRTLPVFRKDIQRAILWSEKHFGDAAADRYLSLIRQGLVDLFDDPLRPGVTTRPELADNVYMYHLKLSRDRLSGQPVNRPRHIIVFRYMEGTVEFARLIHDSRDLARHLPTTYTIS